MECADSLAIPIALALIQMGAPQGAVVAMLIGGPIINLPSLLTLKRNTSWKVSLTTAGGIFLILYVTGIFLNTAVFGSQ